MATETFLGIEMGGTKLLIGEVDRLGNILRYKKYKSAFFNQESAIQIIESSFQDYKDTVGWVGAKPSGIGIGLMGRVDPGKGIWHQIDPFRTHPVELAAMVERFTSIPCKIDNDVKSATRAERVWGVGQFSKNFVFISVGSGIGVGTVVGGRQIRGSHFNAGEAGHMSVSGGIGVKCTCGRTDCAEAIASRTGIDRCARLLKDRYETSLSIPPFGEGLVDAEEVFAREKEGDPLCKVLIENAARAIADLIMNMVRVTDPDTVVLGGSIIVMGNLFTRVLSLLHAPTMRFVTNGVVLTRLNPKFVGLLGAAAVAMDM